jgi:hypothetical protein
MRLPQHLVPYLSTMPQPIALSLGRIARGSSRPEGLEACLKAAEMLARYLAVISLASAAATKPPEEDLPVVEGFEGNLAFGTFVLAIREAIAVSWEHPLREQLRAAMRSTKKHKAVVGVRLEQFVQLRNDLGHAITHVDDLRAASLFEQFDPIGALIECIEDLESVLRCPPLVVVRQEHRRQRLTAQVLFFVGEGDPIPNDIDLRTPVFDWEVAYLCTAAGLLPLSPGLALRPRPDGRRGIYLIDGIQGESIRYKGAFDNDVVVAPGVGQELSRWLGGLHAATPTNGVPLLEPVTCADGRSLFGFLRNEALPAGEVDAAKADAAKPDDAGEVRSVSSFEEAISSVGLGAAFRDIKFAMLQQGCRLESFPQGVRVVQEDTGRVLVVVQLQPGPTLLVTLQLGAFANAGEGTTSFAVRPGQTADEVLERLRELMLEAPSP